MMTVMRVFRILPLLVLLGAAAPESDPIVMVLDLDSASLPALDRAVVGRALEQLAQGALKRLEESKDPSQRLGILLRFLTQERGFSPVETGASLETQQLSRVLATGRGAGEILSLVYADLARRGGIPLSFRYAPDRLLLADDGGVNVDLAEKTVGLTEAAYRKKLKLPDAGPYLDALPPAGIEAFLRRRRAETLLAAGRREPALAEAERAVALDPSRAEHQATLGCARWEIGDLEGAKAALDRAREINPACAAAALLESRLLAAGGDPDRAVEVLGLGLAQAPAPLQPAFYLARGRLREDLGRFSLARADFDKAIALGRQDADAILGRETALLSQALAEAAKRRPVPGGPIPDAKAEVRRLLEEIRQSDEAHRERAQRQLSEMGPRAIPILRQALLEGQPEAKLGALLHLAASPNATCLDAVLDCLRAGEPRIRLGALSALGALAETPAGREGILTRIRGLLPDPDPEVRRRSATVLARFDDPAALPYFRQALGDAEAENRRQAAVVLGRMGDPEAAPLLRQALGDAHPRVRARAAQALGMLKAAPAVPELIGVLKDEDRDVRQEAAAALARITRQAFGTDAGKWEDWWRAQSGGSP